MERPLKTSDQPTKERTETQAKKEKKKIISCKKSSCSEFWPSKLEQDNQKEKQNTSSPKQAEKQYQIQRRTDKCAFQHEGGVGTSAWSMGPEGINGDNWTKRGQGRKRAEKQR
ncbi:hypothetical protein SynPROSU1_00646 [Synechococcus sp. PROS-U-1]|nr:hypothetical protein SynPROSU1_00646 [Synechococcus sp. PROS-U-1]